jgi:hypothetical protein
MINFYNQVPSVYTNASRDFQYLSWLINIVLNSVKHNVDDIYDVPNVGHDPKLSELLALTLGFKVKRNYDQKQLAALVAILPSILKYKGTVKAVKMAVEALVTASGALGDDYCKLNGAHLDVWLPEDLSIDTTLFTDLLDYILPAGTTCRIIRKNITDRKLANIEVGYYDTLHYDVVGDLTWEKNNLSTGLSGLFSFETAGKALTSNSVYGSDIGTYSDEIVLAAGAAKMPTWTIRSINTAQTTNTDQSDEIRISLHNDNGYLSHTDAKVITSTDVEAEWLLTAGKTASTFRVVSTEADSYCLMYGRPKANESSCFRLATADAAGIFDFCLYKKVHENDSGTVYDRVRTIDKIVDGGEFIIVVQMTDLEFTANFKKFNDAFLLNAGLLSNTVIPVLSDDEIVSDDTVELYSTEIDKYGNIIGHKLLYAGPDGNAILLKAKKNL